MTNIHEKYRTQKHKKEMWKKKYKELREKYYDNLRKIETNANKKLNQIKSDVVPKIREQTYKESNYFYNMMTYLNFDFAEYNKGLEILNE